MRKNSLIKTLSGLAVDKHSFCHHLVADPEMDAKAAYLKAKPSAKMASADTGARRWLKDPEVKAYVGRLMEERQKRLQVNEDWVISRLRDIHDRCMQAEPVYDGKLDEEGNPQVAHYKFDASGALKALELMGRHMKMFSDKTDTAQMTVSMSLNLGNKEKPAIEGTYKKVG